MPFHQNPSRLLCTVVGPGLAQLTEREHLAAHRNMTRFAAFSTFAVFGKSMVTAQTGKSPKIVYVKVYAGTKFHTSFRDILQVSVQD